MDIFILNYEALQITEEKERCRVGCPAFLLDACPIGLEFIIETDLHDGMGSRMARARSTME